MEKTVPRCCALSGVSSKEFRVQWLDERKITYLFAALRNDSACIGEHGSKAEKKFGRNRHLLLGADQLSTSALSERLIK